MSNDTMNAIQLIPYYDANFINRIQYCDYNSMNAILHMHCNTVNKIRLMQYCVRNIENAVHTNMLQKMGRKCLHIRIYYFYIGLRESTKVCG